MTIPVIFWTGSGNTQMMADAIAEGIKAGGAEADVKLVGDTTADEAAGFEKLALGCPAMGAEVLEESEFEPFFTELEASLSGKKVVLFGSYGWGGGAYMADWAARCEAAGAELVVPGVTCENAPDEAATAACTAAGEALAKA